jgi:hypothetical protein
MVAVPAAEPAVTTPEEETDAAEPEEVQAPPDGVPVNVAVPSAQSAVGPDIDGDALTVTVVVV